MLWRRQAGWVVGIVCHGLSAQSECGESPNVRSQAVRVLLNNKVNKHRLSYQQRLQVLKSLCAGCFKFFSVLLAVRIS